MFSSKPVRSQLEVAKEQAVREREGREAQRAREVLSQRPSRPTGHQAAACPFRRQALEVAKQQAVREREWMEAQRAREVLSRRPSRPASHPPAACRQSPPVRELSVDSRREAQPPGMGTTPRLPPADQAPRTTWTSLMVRVVVLLLRIVISVCAIMLFLIHYRVAVRKELIEEQTNLLQQLLADVDLGAR